MTQLMILIEGRKFISVVGDCNFSLYGERFCVTDKHQYPGIYVATHIRSGLKLPGVESTNKQGVRKQSLSLARNKGSIKFMQGIRKGVRLSKAIRNDLT